MSELSAPAAFGIGTATYSAAGDGTKVLDTYFPMVNLGGPDDVAAALASRGDLRGGSGTVSLTPNELADVVIELGASSADEEPNRRCLATLRESRFAENPGLGTRLAVVATFIADLDAPPQDAHDVYLRLHLLSHRLRTPHSVNLDGQFGLLANVAWTSHGPADPELLAEVRSRLRAEGRQLTVHSVDKFPRMVDYVVPSGVRIADASRVRLGAHLAEGTTVMHEGFVNFNAGTLGSAMVEGRISAGVVLGDQTDLGGGASVMGTLSGGGKEVISMGERCLVGGQRRVWDFAGRRLRDRGRALPHRRHQGDHAGWVGAEGPGPVRWLTDCCSAETPPPAWWRWCHAGTRLGRPERRVARQLRGSALRACATP